MALTCLVVIIFGQFLVMSGAFHTTEIEAAIDEPEAQAAILGQDDIIKMMCNQRLKSFRCSKRDICLSNGEKFDNECEYFIAFCKGQVSSGDKLIQCRNQGRKIDCTRYNGSSCQDRTEPVCGFKTGKYFPNECMACQSNMDREGDYVIVAENRRCVMQEVGNPMLAQWADSIIRGKYRPRLRQ